MRSAMAASTPRRQLAPVERFARRTHRRRVLEQLPAILQVAQRFRLDNLAGPGIQGDLTI